MALRFSALMGSPGRGIDKTLWKTGGKTLKVRTIGTSEFEIQVLLKVRMAEPFPTHNYRLPLDTIP